MNCRKGTSAERDTPVTAGKKPVSGMAKQQLREQVRRPGKWQALHGWKARDHSGVRLPGESHRNTWDYIHDGAVASRLKGKELIPIKTKTPAFLRST